MSIGPVSGVSAGTPAAAPAPKAPDVGETPGAPDHDSDGDNSAQAVTQAAPKGLVDVKA